MPHETRPPVRGRDREAIVQSLRAGVTPRTGLQHIQVGRYHEVTALLSDIQNISEGGSAIRFVIGQFGSGKTFFLQLVRNMAQEKGLVTVHADLAPDRRLHASAGQARGLYAELMKNLSTRTKPEGGALVSVVERFITETRRESERTGKPVKEIIQERLQDLTDFVGGYDFAKVIEAYWTGHENGNEKLKSDAVRWLRGEFSTKTDARLALDVRVIVTDENVYDHLKLLSLFVRQAGYSGLLVNLDEMVNLYKLPSARARLANYEQILRILNDCLQGSASHLGFIFGGTPDFIYDSRKGLYCYEALQSRLAQNTFARMAGVADYKGPVLNLPNLRPEELYILLQNVRHVYASGNPDHYLVTDEVIMAFLEHCEKKIGEVYFRTPRNTIKAFVDFLAVLEQHPDIRWDSLIDKVELEKEINTDLEGFEGAEDDEELATFTL